MTGSRCFSHFQGINLLANQSDVRKLNDHNCRGDTALTYASRKGQLAICEILMQAGACVNKSTHHVRQTPLLIALEAGFRDVVHCLLDAGADVQLIDNVGMSPLYVAIKNRDTDIVSRLIKCGCDVNYGSQDHAPIFLAARKGMLEITQVAAIEQVVH